jgi:hypothetical protein
MILVVRNGLFENYEGRGDHDLRVYSITVLATWREETHDSVSIADLQMWVCFGDPRT